MLFVQLGPSVTGASGGRTMITDVGGLNYKGLFTRGRRPKAAAALLSQARPNPCYGPQAV